MEWISTKDRLPGHTKKVWVKYDGKLSTCRYYPSIKTWDAYNSEKYVTHWAEIEPPKEN